MRRSLSRPTAVVLALAISLVTAPAHAQRAGLVPLPEAASLTTGLVGNWWEGTLSTIQFYDPTTGTWEAPNGTGTFLLLYANGTFRAGGILNVTNGACTSTLMVDEHGTYTVSGTTAGTLTLARQTGHSRFTDTCTTQVYDRVLEPETRTFGYTLGQDPQGDDTLTRSENGTYHSTMRRWGGSTPPPTGALVALRTFDPAGAQTISLIDQIAPLDSGFVYGTNLYDDRQKATLFTLPGTQAAGELVEVDVYFGHAVDNDDLFYGVSVYNGAADTGPTGDPLAVEVYSFSRIQTDGNASTPSPPTVHRFAAPVAVGRQFFVSVRMLTNGYAVGNLALASSAPAVGRVPGVWEQWADGSWHNVSDAWWGTGTPGSGTAGAQLWIEARVAATSTAGEGEVATAGTLALAPVAPNPTRGAATVRFTLGAAAEATVDVLDVTGRTVRQVASGLRPAGAHTVALGTESLAPGVYLVRVQAAGAVETVRMTVTR